MNNNNTFYLVLGILIGLVIGEVLAIIGVQNLPAQPQFRPGDQVAVIFNTASVHDGVGCMENDYAIVNSVGATGEKEWFKLGIISLVYPNGNLVWMPLNLVVNPHTTILNLCPARNQSPENK